jgi:hypothetical protein
MYYNGQKKRRLTVEKMGKPAPKMSEKRPAMAYILLLMMT